MNKYNKALHYSILFYEAQRTGYLPANNRIPWRGNSVVKDGCAIEKDLTKGWFDGKNGHEKLYQMRSYLWSILHN